MKIITSNFIHILAALALGSAAGASPSPEVIVLRTPDDGIQPVAEADTAGNVHLLYFRGEPAHGNLFYTVRRQGADQFEPAVRVNTQDDCAIAIGTIRGAQLAIGRDGYIHVAWMGSSNTRPEKEHHLTPMLYTRSIDGGKTFEPERNLITESYGLDGGGAIAADSTGRVDVFWHAGKPDSGEVGRQIWVTRSSDDGKTFAKEVPAWDESTGVCGCCGMTAGASAGRSWVMYRAATDKVNRDIYLLGSDGATLKFSGQKLDQWETDSCPMSAMSLGFSGNATAAAWETKEGDVAYTIAGTDLHGRVPHDKVKRKYPDVALAPDGHTLLAWIDGAGWNKGGQLSWQMFDSKANPIGQLKTIGDSAVWTKPAAVYNGDAFLIIY
jgi:hypothetical protein